MRSQRERPEKGKPIERLGRKAMGSKSGNGYDSPVAKYFDFASNIDAILKGERNDGKEKF